MLVRPWFGQDSSAARPNRAASPVSTKHDFHQSFKRLDVLSCVVLLEAAEDAAAQERRAEADL